MTEKSGWKKKRKSSAADLDIFRATADADFNYKNIQLDGPGDDPNETNFTKPTPVPGVEPVLGPGPSSEETPDDFEIPEWKMPDDGFIPKVPEKKADHPGFWAFSRLLNRVIDQLNWFLKYLYGAKTAVTKPEPSALSVLWAVSLVIIMLVVQVIFVIPNIISYFAEFIGICFAVLLFEMINPDEDREKYRQGIDSAISGTTGIVGTGVAFLVTLNIWYAISVRESDTDLVSMLEQIFSKTIFGFFRHGLAGVLLLNHMFGRMKMGKTMQEDSSSPMMGGAGFDASMASDFMNGDALALKASKATAVQYENLISKFKKNPTISFIILFLIIQGAFMSGAFSQLMNSQNTIKSAMGDGAGSPVWYIIVIFCMVASAVSFLSVLPGSFNVAAPLLSLFYILMLLIATMVTFHLGSIGSIMLIFYFMFMVIPVEAFRSWGITVTSIFKSFALDHEADGKIPKIFFKYGVILVFALSIMGSFVNMMVNVSKSMPPNPKLSGGLVGIGGAGLIATLVFLYLFVFPNNIKGLIREIFPEEKPASQSPNAYEYGSPKGPQQGKYSI
jgi:hypothetical protein